MKTNKSIAQCVVRTLHSPVSDRSLSCISAGGRTTYYFTGMGMDGEVRSWSVIYIYRYICKQCKECLSTQLDGVPLAQANLHHYLCRLYFYPNLSASFWSQTNFVHCSEHGCSSLNSNLYQNKLFRLCGIRMRCVPPTASKLLYRSIRYLK